MKKSIDQRIFAKKLKHLQIVAAKPVASGLQTCWYMYMVKPKVDYLYKNMLKHVFITS